MNLEKHFILINCVKALHAYRIFEELDLMLILNFKSIGNIAYLDRTYPSYNIHLLRQI